MPNILQLIHDAVWGAPALLLILGVGLYLTFRTGFSQFALFPAACMGFIRKFRNREPGGGVSPFQALCTALAATVGTGNLVGVAGAICLGGPGAVFWMWVCGFLGMATKFAEVTLALHYRIPSGKEYLGGPMYIISLGMGGKWRWLASLYCFFGVIAAFGVGNATQINAVIRGINGVLVRFGGRESTSGNLLMGLALAVLVGAMLLGGARRIGQAAELLVPFVSLLYILLCLGVLIVRLEALPGALLSILEGAFCPRAVTGGALGSAFCVMRIGCARGVFTNEAGMGTASIAHAAARVSHPVEQGLMGIMEVFLDTILICTLTALTILVSGESIPYGKDLGGDLTVAAFSCIYGDWVSILIAASLCCFAFATVLGWGLYGGRCGQFLFGDRSWNLFAVLQTIAVMTGAVLNTETVWLLAETVNGLMALPNLVALAVLTPVVVRLRQEYRPGA